MPAIGIQVSNLVAAFDRAVAQSLDVMEEVPARRARIEHAADASFANIGLGAILTAKEDASRCDVQPCPAEEHEA